MSDDQQFITALVALAKACDFQMSEELMGFYHDALKPLGFPRVTAAIRETLVNRRGQDRMPSIRDLRDLIEPSNTVEGAAQELLTRVIEAVEKYGYYDPEAAKIYMGDIAWNALPGARGWEEFCCDPIPVGTARAQLRDRLTAAIRRANPMGRVALAPPGNPGPRLTVFHASKEEALEKGLTPLKDLLKLERGGK